jgi:hypothetical protein
MNILSLLLLGAPTSATPNVGPWIHFFWVLLILCLILFVLWWVWTKISGMIPEPIRTIVMVLGVVALAAIIIIYVLMPLMGVF